MRPGEGVGGQVLKTGRPVITNAYQEDVRGCRRPASPSTADRGRRADALGRRAARRAVGRLQPHAPRHPGRPALLEAFADLASVACRNAEAFRAASRSTR